MPRLLLVRHAQSEWNALGRWQGLADPPLSDLGELQEKPAYRTRIEFYTGMAVFGGKAAARIRGVLNA